MPLPIVAIVGLPNAGKSTLFNKIVGGQLAVTSEIAGTTRDRQYADVGWNKQQFSLVDTAGLDFFGTPSFSPPSLGGVRGGISELEVSVKKQIEVATQEADILLLVVDGKTGVEALDRNVLLTFRKIKKPVVVAVNKLDSPRNTEVLTAPFYKLGIKHIFPISSVTGRGIGDLLDHLVSTLGHTDRGRPSAAEGRPLSGIHVAIVGKPNVGKSSIFNKILDNERAVVSNVPGTTRTAIDSKIEIDGIDYTFIDTAGLKKKEHRQAKPDIYSGFQTYKSIRRSDVCLLILDATEPVTSQDKSIAEEIIHQEKGCIVLVNKIDAYLANSKSIDKSDHSGSSPRVGEARRGTSQVKDKGLMIKDRTLDPLHAYISHHFPFLWMCPVYFVSGLTGEGLLEALQQIKPIYERRRKKIEPEDLKQLLAKRMKLNPPKRLLDQKVPKILGLIQTDINSPALSAGTAPLSGAPKFQLLVNHTPAIQENFRQSVENAIIKELDFWGTPIKVHKVKKI